MLEDFDPILTTKGLTMPSFSQSNPQPCLVATNVAARPLEYVAQHAKPRFMHLIFRARRPPMWSLRLPSPAENFLGL